MTIINLRGTSGSGKTTLARKIMAEYLPGGSMEIFREGRRRPIYTRHVPLESTGLKRTLRVLGHYQAACGGCDTITELDDVFNLLRDGVTAGDDVLLEGLILSGEIQRTLAVGEWLAEQGRVMDVMALTTPVDQCVENVNARRRARGVEEPVRPKNTLAKARCVELTMPRLTNMPGLRCGWYSFDDAFVNVMEKLRHG